MRPTIRRTPTGAIVLYLDAPAVTVTLSADDAVMLACEIAGCVAGLVVMVPSAPEDPGLPEFPDSLDPHPEIPHLPGWMRVVDALPNPKCRIEVMYYDGMTEREGAALYDWPGEGVYRKTHWRYV